MTRKTSFALTAFLIVFSPLDSVASAQEFERVLVPAVANEPIAGAFGSQWVTEISGRYGGLGRLQFFFPVCPLFECTYLEVAPNTTFLSGFPTSPHGAVVQFRHDQARETVLSARVRDLSRALNTWGTEIPVVRESEVGETTIELLNLPTGDRFRFAIRMYDFRPSGGDSVSGMFIVTFFALDGTSAIAEVVVPIQELHAASGGTQGIGFALITERALPPTVPERIRATVRMSEPGKFWAFASITNNETQHVTVISPARAPVHP
jgi:hypothetical protein